jgi:hypothetical protein
MVAVGLARQVCCVGWQLTEALLYLAGRLLAGVCWTVCILMEHSHW